MPEIIAVIPALNEAETIGALVRDLKQSGISAIVVNDGSTDETGSLALKAGADMVIYHDAPWNIGPSIIDGLKAAMRTDARRFLVIDAGGSHNPQDIPALAAVDADVVIGSRFLPLSGYTGTNRRRDASKLAAAMLNFCKPNGPQLSDWTSGFRLYSRKAVGELIYQRYYTDGHAWQIECLMQAIRRKLIIKEAPIHYTAGRSSLRMKSIMDAFGLWLEYFWS